MENNDSYKNTPIFTNWTKIQQVLSFYPETHYLTNVPTQDKKWQGWNNWEILGRYQCELCWLTISVIVFVNDPFFHDQNFDNN